MSIVRVGLAETRQYSDGWAAIFGKKTGVAKPSKRSAKSEVRTKAESNVGVPAEVEAEFTKWLDEYIEGWSTQAIAAFGVKSANRSHNREPRVKKGSRQAKQPAPKAAKAKAKPRKGKK